MTLNEISQLLPEYAKDLKLNLSSILSETGAPGLAARQIFGTALACALAARSGKFATAIQAQAGDALQAQDVRAAHAAAAIMGMNNVYYRFLHLVGDEEYQKLPAGLRMRVIADPGVAKVDFELYSLAVSAIHGCGKCIAAHEHTLRQEGLSRQAIQSAVRIASVVHAIAGVLEHPAVEAGQQQDAA